MSHSEFDPKEEAREVAEMFLDRVAPWVSKWLVFAWAATVGGVVAYDLGESLYHALPGGVTWAELPSIVTPRVAVAILFGLVCFRVFINWALSLTERFERYVKNEGVR